MQRIECSVFGQSILLRCHLGLGLSHRSKGGAGARTLSIEPPSL